MKKTRAAKYSVQWFINKFNRIPKRLWSYGSIKPRESGAMCALGHVCTTLSHEAEYVLTEEGRALCKLLGQRETNYVAVFTINDRIGYNNERDPKANIITALRILTE